MAHAEGNGRTTGDIRVISVSKMQGEPAHRMDHNRNHGMRGPNMNQIIDKTNNSCSVERMDARDRMQLEVSKSDIAW